MVGIVQGLEKNHPSSLLSPVGLEAEMLLFSLLLLSLFLINFMSQYYNISEDCEQDTSCLLPGFVLMWDCGMSDKPLGQKVSP